MSIADTSGEQTQPPIAMPARFTVTQFDRMIETGVLAGTDSKKVQLFRGEVVYMTPPNPPHDDVISMLTSWAYRSLVEIEPGNEVEVCVQLSMDLPDQDSVVSPDLAFVTAQPYSTRRPTANDTYLLIEVSDSSLAYDTGNKCALYADAGVQEYWVIDVPHRSLIVHRDPSEGRYRSVQTHDESQPVEPSRLPGISLAIGTLFR
jgi:Uma2 family endonuclease